MENSVGRDDSVWKKVWEVVKFLLLFCACSPLCATAKKGYI